MGVELLQRSQHWERLAVLQIQCSKCLFCKGILLVATLATLATLKYIHVCES